MYYVNFDNHYRTVETLVIMENESLYAFFVRILAWLRENAEPRRVISMFAGFEAEELEDIADIYGIELN
jgi:hypothetical protein